MSKEEGITTDHAGIKRCFWCGQHEDYQRYHDLEWGRPQDDDFILFEKACLEGFQSGLSWLTVLRKRERFREVFLGFDFHKVARFGEQEVLTLLQDPGIIRHRKKIEATINNAQVAIELKQEFGSLAAYFWQYEPSSNERPSTLDYTQLIKLDKTPTSIALSQDLKKRGWRFFGPTTAYAFMQAMGMVNDHMTGCSLHNEIEQLRRDFVRPKKQHE